MADGHQDIYEGSSVSAPRIAGFVGDESITYFFVIEHAIVFSATTSFTRPLMLWFVSHYDIVRILYDHTIFLQEFVFGLSVKLNKGATYLTVTSESLSSLIE